MLYNITYVWNLKNKLVNITKKKQTHRHREQIRGYLWREERGRGSTGVGAQGVQTTLENKPQGYIIQNGDYGQCFIIPVTGA